MSLNLHVAGILTTLAIAAISSTSRAQDSSSHSTAASSQVRTVKAERRDGSIELDGRLDEAAWSKAQVARDFVQSWPNPGKPGTEPTEVRVLYDDEALYVGARMFDSRPDSIAAQLARRDAGGIYSDWIHVMIDSYHDRRSGFRFTVNPRGVQKDVSMSNDNNEDVNWDAVWDVATRVDSLGWVAEFRIPLSQLRFESAPRGAERVFGFQVMRDIARREERSAFTPWEPNGRGFVSVFGDLTGLVDLSQPRRLEVMPYVSTKLTNAPKRPGADNDPFYSRYETKPNAGADLKFGLPGGLTLTATVNPDFGQVELDPAQVNLTAFETFFSEKRPFFLEGADVFSFGQLRRSNDYGGQTFFYTRRIGRTPSRFPNGPNILYVDMPDETSILGAMKITGRRGPWVIGVMDALTGEERARVAGPGGTVDSSTAVEPLSNFAAVRARRDFRNGRSFIGGIGTMVNRRQSDLFRNMLSTSAGLGGVDFEHRWSANKYVLSGYALGSRVNGSRAVIDAVQRSAAHYFHRPDARTLVYDPTRNSLTGHHAAVALQKTGNSFGSIVFKEVSPEYEINDVGFHGRVDFRAVSPFWGFQSNQADSWSRNKFAGIWSNHVWNFDGNPIYQGIGGEISASFLNFWSASTGFQTNLPAYSDRLLRGGPLARMPMSYSLRANFNTDTRRKLWTNPFVNVTRYVDDPSWSTHVGLYTESRPTSNLRITFSPSYSRQFSTSQHVRNIADPTADATYDFRYMFANIEQTTLALETRVNWTLTPKLSFQSYVQPFVAVGTYRDFKEFTTPREFDFAVYGRDRGTITAGTSSFGQPNYTVDPDGSGPAAAFSFGNPNFNSHSLRGNAVVRWEYRPGSALFVVWQQQRSGAERSFDFDAQRDIGAIFREPPTNIFMVKAVYWLSP